MTAEKAERLGRAIGERLALTVQVPDWGDDTRTEEVGALWQNFADGLVDQLRITLVRNK